MKLTKNFQLSFVAEEDEISCVKTNLTYSNFIPKLLRKVNYTGLSFYLLFYQPISADS
jgi:hypothetical protein